MIPRFTPWTIVASVLCLAGCGGGFVRDEVLVGPYRLVAVDLPEDMMLCRSLAKDGTCVGDGLPAPTVFQVGYNDKYLAAARHPRMWGEGC